MYNHRMQHTRFIGLMLFLVFGTLFLSTFLVMVERDTVALEQEFPAKITLTYPRRIYLGQSAKVSVEVVMLEENQAMAPIILVARLEGNIGAVSPLGEIQAVIQPGKPMAVTWKFRPFRSDIYPVTIWLSAREASGEQLLLARDIEIESRDFLSTRVENIRVAAGLLMGVGIGIILFGLGQRKKKATP
jgi:hypothetical protein